MRVIINCLLLVVVCVSCETKLTDEQRKALRDEMKDREIKKIGPEEIYQKALTEGRQLVMELTPTLDLDSVQRICNCTIKYTRNAESLSDKQTELFEAYKYEPGAPDNIQKDGDELLIYSKPEVTADTLHGVWMISYEKKDIVKLL